MIFKNNKIIKLTLSKNILFCLMSFTFLLTNCVDEVKINLRQETKKLVVEGLLSDNNNFQSLRLSFTNTSDLLSGIEPAKGAVVELYENEKLITVYRPIPNEIGNYRPLEPNFVGIPGKSYYIVVKLFDNRIYKTKPQVLPKSVDISKITNTFVSDNDTGFLTSIDFNDPKNSKDFYRWTAKGYHKRISKGVLRGFGPGVCCTDCWVLKEESTLNLFSDEAANGGEIKNRKVFFSPFYALGKHFIEVNQYVITKEAFLFWQKYQGQKQRTGTIFDPLPAAINGNLVNINDTQDIALGFFEVASITSKKTEANAITQTLEATFFNNDLYVAPGDCMQAYSNSSYSESKPIGW
jgi:hypothetical protein